MNNAGGSEQQKEHYGNIHDSYEAHYYDAMSTLFREKFIYPVLLQENKLNGKCVAELACGSGYNSVYLKKKFPEIVLTGYDISEKACVAYKKNVGSDCYEFDLTQKADLKSEYDFAIVIGGIHHCVSSLEHTFSNIHSMLKPGGSLLMCEASSSFLLEPVRKFWYKKSKYFQADTEEALDHDKLFTTYGDGFESKWVQYMGGPAYFLVLNSLIFHLPLPVKRIISHPLFLIEKIYNFLPTKQFFPYFVAEWVKK